MYECIVILRNLEEAEALTVLINKHKQQPKSKVWGGDFWEYRFKSDTEWGVAIKIEGPQQIKHFSYCDMPWYEKSKAYYDTDFIYLEEFIETLMAGKKIFKPKTEPFIKTVTMEAIYGL